SSWLLESRRRKVGKSVRGTVLDVGFGTGISREFYPNLIVGRAAGGVRSAASEEPAQHAHQPTRVRSRDPVFLLLLRTVPTFVVAPAGVEGAGVGFDLGRDAFLCQGLLECCT